MKCVNIIQLTECLDIYLYMLSVIRTRNELIQKLPKKILITKRIEFHKKYEIGEKRCWLSIETKNKIIVKTLMFLEKCNFCYFHSHFSFSIPQKGREKKFNFQIVDEIALNWVNVQTTRDVPMRAKHWILAHYENTFAVTEKCPN